MRICYMHREQDRVEVLRPRSTTATSARCCCCGSLPMLLLVVLVVFSRLVLLMLYTAAGSTSAGAGRPLLLAPCPVPGRPSQPHLLHGLWALVIWEALAQVD